MERKESKIEVEVEEEEETGKSTHNQPSAQESKQLGGIRRYRNLIEAKQQQQQQPVRFRFGFAFPLNHFVVTSPRCVVSSMGTVKKKALLRNGLHLAGSSSRSSSVRQAGRQAGPRQSICQAILRSSLSVNTNLVLFQMNKRGIQNM